VTLRLALIEATATLRQRIVNTVEAADPLSQLDIFGVPPRSLPDATFDWRPVDCIVIGEFEDEAKGLAFVRALTLNPKRRPVVFLMDEDPDTPLSVSLKLLAEAKLPRWTWKDGELMAALMYVSRDRRALLTMTGSLGQYKPALTKTVALPVISPSIVAAETVAAKALHTNVAANADADFIKTQPNLAIAAMYGTQPLNTIAAPDVTIIDGSQGYRQMLATFIRVRWPRAEIAEIDPFSQTDDHQVYLAATRSKLIVLSAIATRDEGLKALALLRMHSHCPPIIVAVPRVMQIDVAALSAAGADDVLFKDALSQQSLTVALARWQSPEIDHAEAGSSTTDFGKFSFVAKGQPQVIEIERYRFVSTLVQTPMSRVFVAERMADRKRVIVKVANEAYFEAQTTRVFSERYPIFSGLNGNGVVRYLDAGVAGMWPYVVLEYLHGGDLRQRITTGMQPVEAVLVMYRLAIVLSTLHSKQMAHLDLKPENILFRENDDLVLIDFNTSARFGQQFGQSARATDGKTILGSPAYMSPEQGRGVSIDGRSDLYSAGVVFFEMLSGNKPYTAKNDAELIFRHIHEEPPLLPRAIRHLQPIIDGLMAKDPEERCPSADDLARALEPFLKTGFPQSDLPLPGTSPSVS
jgi:eukaryotic-like serine/threonine-protein kinase